MPQPGHRSSEDTEDPRRGSAEGTVEGPGRGWGCTVPIRNTSGVSGCSCTSVNEKWEDSNTSFMDFTALQWGSDKIIHRSLTKVFF